MSDSIYFSLLKGQKLKKTVNEFLVDDNWQKNISGLIEIHGAKLSNSFFSASYNNSKIISNRAIKSFHFLAEHLSKNSLEKIRILIRKCIWMLTEESGGIPWNAPRIMGEIMASNLIIAEEFIKILFSYIYETEDCYDNFLENTQLRKGVYYAITRISGKYPQLIFQEKDVLKQRMEKETDVEIIACLCQIISNSNLGDFYYFIENNFSNKEQIEIYMDDKIIKSTIGEIAIASKNKMRFL